MRVYEDLGWPVNDDSSMTCDHHELCSPRVASHLRSLTKRMPPMLTKRIPPMLTERMHSPTSGR